MSTGSRSEIPPLHVRYPTWFASDPDGYTPVWSEQKPLSVRFPGVAPGRVIELIDTDDFRRRRQLVEFSHRLRWLELGLGSSERGHQNPAAGITDEFETIRREADTAFAARLAIQGWNEHEQAAAMGVIIGQVVLPMPE